MEHYIESARDNLEYAYEEEQREEVKEHINEILCQLEDLRLEFYARKST